MKIDPHYIGGDPLDFKTKNKNISQKNNFNISEIEKKIDEMFTKKQKTPNTPPKEINFQEISLRSKNGKHIYYLKKKTTQKNKPSLKKTIILKEEPSKKHLHKTKDTLEKDELIEVIKKPAQTPTNKKIYLDIRNINLLKNKHIRFTTKEIEKQNAKPKTKKQIKPITKIPKIKSNEQLKTISKNKPSIKQKITKPGHILKNKTIKKVKEKKPILKTKTPHKPTLVKPKETITPKQKIENIPFFDINDSKHLKEQTILNEKIKEIPQKPLEETPEKKKNIIRKKLFTKKKKPKTKKEEKIKPLKPTREKTDSSSTAFRFKVENMPSYDETLEEIKLVDEQIKETINTPSNNDKPDDPQIKADEIIKNHIKEKPLNVEQIPYFKDKKPSEEKLSEIFPSSSNEGEVEHVFFDEHVDFEGWTPNISDKERKQLSLPVQPEPELKPEAIEYVKDVELPKEALSKSVSLKELGFSENEWEEIDFYPLNEPFSYVEILREKESFEKRYFLVEVEITEEEKEILDFITDTLKSYSFDTEEYELRDQAEYLLTVFEDIIKEYNITLTENSKSKILYFLGKTSIGFGKLDPIMHDPNIEDISCDGAGIPIFLYHRKYGSLKSNIEFKTEEELSSFIYRLAQKCGKHISIAEPMLDATMPDGSRIQMTLSDEITTRGSTFTIRKFKDDPFSPSDLLEYNTMSSEMIAYLWLAIENGVNALFAGGTASGKTTALNAVALFIPPDSKIVTIEETRELNLPHKNWIPGVARTGFGPVIADKMQGEIDMYDLMKAALRQRPEYIIVGEIRGREAYVLFQAMATGHATYSTVHADSAQSLIHRLEGKPINIPRVMLQSLDIVSLHVTTRVKNNRVRRCKQIIEIIDIDPTTKEILTNEVFRWDPVEDKFIYSGKSYVLERIRAEKDLSREEMTQEIQRRQRIIEWMNKNNIREFKEVANIIARYGENPSEVMEQIDGEGKEVNE